MINSDSKEYLKNLQKKGWVVIPILSHEEIETAKSLFWDWLEALDSGIKRTDVSTWSDDNWPGDLVRGFISNHGISQSKFVWYLRGSPKVKQIFSEIWKTDDLICSMDSIICWRPWWKCDDEDWLPCVEKLHIDQNPCNKPGFHCVQGMMVLQDVSEEIGGLQFVSGSHTIENQKKLSKHFTILDGDWCPLDSTTSNLLIKDGAELIQAKAGDFIIWDSRLIHGGRVGTRKYDYKDKDTNPGKLARLVVPICMMPRDKVDKYVLDRRREAFKEKLTFNHWPDECQMTLTGNSNGINIKNPYPEDYQLNKDELSLL